MSTSTDDADIVTSESIIARDKRVTGSAGMYGATWTDQNNVKRPILDPDLADTCVLNLSARLDRSAENFLGTLPGPSQVIVYDSEGYLPHFEIRKQTGSRGDEPISSSAAVFETRTKFQQIVRAIHDNWEETEIVPAHAQMLALLNAVEGARPDGHTDANNKHVPSATFRSWMIPADAPKFRMTTTYTRASGSACPKVTVTLVKVGEDENTNKGRKKGRGGGSRPSKEVTPPGTDYNVTERSLEEAWASVRSFAERQLREAASEVSSGPESIRVEVAQQLWSDDLEAFVPDSQLVRQYAGSDEPS